MHWILHPGDSLGNRTANAGVWAFALSTVTKSLRIVRLVVVANFLGTGEVGLMGIALLTLALLETFTTTGFSQALVQREGDIKDHLDVAWTIAVIRGIVLAVLLLAGAPLIAAFFKNDAATSVIRALALVVFLNGLNNIGVVFFDKELEFRQRFVYRSLPHVVDLVVAVTAAIMLQSVWALVLGRVANQLTMTIGSYVAQGYRPKLRFDREKTMDLVRFGSWILGSMILVFLMLNLDDIVVGRVLSTEDLALYQMAFTISALITEQIAGVVNDVAFPALSKLQGDLPRLRNAYLQALQLVALLAMPITAGLWFLGPTAVEVFLTEEWLPLLAAYDVLLIWGLVRAVAGTTDPLFNSVGKPYVNTALWTATVVLLGITIYPFTTMWGIRGAAWATVVAAVPFVVGLYVATRTLQTRILSLLRPLAVPIMSAALMLAILTLIKNWVPDLDNAWMLGWAPLVGASVYFVAIFTAHRYLGYAPGGLFPKLGLRASTSD